MKYVLVLVIFFSMYSQAQADLQFNKRFVQSEDRWVVFQPGKDSVYNFGFIYIDAQAGLTLNHEGTFTVSPSGEYVPSKTTEHSVKFRLEPNDVLVAFIPANRFKELKIEAIPYWLQYYKKDTGSVSRLYRWGYMYNAWNECEKALTFLEKAEKTDPRFKGLAVELAYSYNCLKQYDKAEKILEEEIKSNGSDAYVNKEYIFTLSKNNKITKAEEQFELSLKKVKDDQYHAENAFNIMQHFYNNKDKENFSKWYKKLQNYPTENKNIAQYANYMRDDLNK